MFKKKKKEKKRCKREGKEEGSEKCSFSFSLRRIQSPTFPAFPWSFAFFLSLPLTFILSFSACACPYCNQCDRHSNTCAANCVSSSSTSSAGVTHSCSSPTPSFPDVPVGKGENPTRSLPPRLASSAKAKLP